MINKPTPDWRWHYMVHTSGPGEKYPLLWTKTRYYADILLYVLSNFRCCLDGKGGVFFHSVAPNSI